MKTPVRSRNIGVYKGLSFGFICHQLYIIYIENHSDMFDVTMGSFDRAEVCKLIGLFLLNILSEKYGKNNVGLYRDDGLVLLRNANGPQSEWTRKDITQEFKKQGVNISINTNLKICNFLNVTLNLSDRTYYPY